MAELTVYPDPDPESDSIDGYIYSVQPLWSDARLYGFSKTDSLNKIYCKSQEMVGDSEYRVFRVFISFDTSALGAGAVVSAATISVYGSDIVGNPTIHCVESTQAADAALVTDDFNEVGTTSFATIGPGLSSGSYLDYVLSAAGWAIILLTGTTKYAFREDHDFSNSAPAADAEHLFGSWSADDAGTSRDPKLVITYEPPPVVANTSTSRRLGFGLGLDVG